MINACRNEIMVSVYLFLYICVLRYVIDLRMFINLALTKILGQKDVSKYIEEIKSESRCDKRDTISSLLKSAAFRKPLFIAAGLQIARQFSGVFVVRIITYLRFFLWKYTLNALLYLKCVTKFQTT